MYRSFAVDMTAVTAARDEGVTGKALRGLPAHSWDVLLEESASCLRLPSRHASVLQAIDAQDPCVHIMGQKETLIQAIYAQLPKNLAAYIEELLDTYEAFMNADIMRIRLETVTSRACWKWHRDYTTLRLITTLRGAGTQYLLDPSQPDAISSCDTGDIGLFKGRLFGDYFGLQGHGACVHRSPPWNKNDTPRLLLVIDMPQNFEIENANF